MPEKQVSCWNGHPRKGKVIKIPDKPKHECFLLDFLIMWNDPTGLYSFSKETSGINLQIISFAYILSYLPLFLSPVNHQVFTSIWVNAIIFESSKSPGFYQYLSKREAWH